MTVAKKEKRVSINALEKLLPEKSCVTVALDGGVEITVRRHIGLDEVLSFVDEAAQVCFDEENGAYLPEALDFAIKRNLATRYANLTLPENVDRQYDLLYGTGIAAKVLEHIDPEQYHEICGAINKRIEYMLRGSLSMERRQLHEAARKLEEMSDSMARIFEGVDISAVMEAMGKLKDMDEEKIVQALAGLSAAPDAAR